jgi:chromate transporter
MKEKKARTLWQLFVTFLKIGAFTFGGGYAMIPLIQRETAERRGWISDRDILEIVAVAESTPGPIAINSATFVGYRVCGFWGAFCATVGVVLPSFVIITGISYVLAAFENLRAVKYAFLGIRAGVLALILKALVSMYRQAPKHAAACAIMFCAFLLVAVLRVNVLCVIIGCALAGLAYSLAAERRART